MANPEHLKILDEGVDAWNNWRQENAEIIPDLSGSDLAGRELWSIDFHWADLSEADLGFTELIRSDLSGANFTAARLEGSYLDGANLMATVFVNADLRSATLTYADMETAHLHNANFFEGNPEHRSLLCKSVEEWNAWRAENPQIIPDLRGINFYRAEFHNIDLRGADLRKACLIQCYFFQADFSNANLVGARLTGSDLAGVNLSNVDLSNAYLSRTNLCIANLSNANLTEAQLFDAQLVEANLSSTNFSKATLVGAKFSRSTLVNANLSEAELGNADLSEADLTKANLRGARPILANLSDANLTDADLTRADLTQANLVRTIMDGVSLSNSAVYGVSAWDLDLSKVKDQSDLEITPFDKPTVTVDNLDVAQYMYMMLQNTKIRDIIDSTADKIVLILGRFGQERKEVLDFIKERLQHLNYVPVLFDWQNSEERDLTETVMLLANLSRFVIADITDAKSIPQELSNIVPNFPSVPVLPIILTDQREYAMFEHFKAYPWVLPVYEYDQIDDLYDNFENAIISPILQWEKESEVAPDLKEQMRAKDKENEKLRAELAALKKGVD